MGQPGGREAQPTSERDVERHAADAERQQAHSRPTGDDAGINPKRQDGSDAGPDHDDDRHDDDREERP